jgi:hypothetical protein
MTEFIEGQPINIKRFVWASGNGYAEASSLPDLKLHQIWPDSCDEGFTVISERTGLMRTFVKHGDTRRDGEIVATVFVSISQKTGRADTPCNRLSITIWND